MSYSSGSSSSAPSWYTDQFLGGSVLPFAQQQMKQYTQNGGQTPLSQAGQSQLLATVRGDYLNPSSNPNLQSVAEIIRRNSEEALGKSLGQIGQGAEAVGGLFSTKTAQQKAAAARAATQDVADRLTNLYAGNYAAERQNQVNASNTASNLDFEKLLRLADALKTQVSSGSTMGFGIL